MLVRLLTGVLLSLLVTACADPNGLPKGAGKGYTIASISVDTTKLTPKQLISLPADAKKIDKDLTRALTRELVNVSGSSGPPATFVVEVTDFTLGDNGACDPNYCFSMVRAVAELRDKRTGTVIVPAGNIFSVTPRTVGDATKMAIGILTLNRSMFKTKDQDYTDTVNNFARATKVNLLNAP